MKKIMASMALAIIALGSQAQVLKSDLLKGYSSGDKLEKAVYGDKRDPINENTWCGAFTSNPVEGAEGPTVGKTLTYEGYAEGGQAQGEAFLKLSAASGVRGLSFDYPEQVSSALPTVTEYPYCIQALGKDVYVVNVGLRAAYNGLDLFYRS